MEIEKEILKEFGRKFSLSTGKQQANRVQTNNDFIQNLIDKVQQLKEIENK